MNRTDAPSQRWLTPLCILVLIAASLVPILAATHLTHPIDDAYITMVYARSIAQGRGFTFGLDPQATLGTTTPLNTLILALLYKLLPDVDAAGIAVSVSVIAWIATGWLWFIGGAALGLNRLERFFIAVLVLIETTTWIEHLGMETWLFVFLLTLCVIAYCRGWLIFTGVLIGALFLTRGEGILIAVPIGLHLIRQKDWFRRGLRIAAGGLIVLIPWAIYAAVAFGSPLPSTLSAKMAQLQFGFTRPFIVYVGYVFLVGWSNLGVFGVTTWLILFVAGLIYAFRARRKLLIFPAWALLFVTLYGILNIPTYKWYALPVTYVATVFAGFAIAGIATLVTRGETGNGEVIVQRRGYVMVQRRGYVVAIGALLLVAAILLPKNIPSAPVGDWRYTVYSRLAAWLDSHTSEGSSVAYVEIGVLGWSGDRRVIDLLGLTNPELIPAIKRGDLNAAFTQSAPDTLICASLFAWACKPILASSDFAQNYTQTATFTGAELGAPEIASEKFTIYQKKS